MSHARGACQEPFAEHAHQYLTDQDMHAGRLHLEKGACAMEILYARCCGLDIHKRTVVACLFVPGAEGTPTKEIRTFGTMTNDLLALSEWLAAAQFSHVAMESTARLLEPVRNPLGS